MVSLHSGTAPHLSHIILHACVFLFYASRKGVWVWSRQCRQRRSVSARACSCFSERILISMSLHLWGKRPRSPKIYFPYYLNLAIPWQKNHWPVLSSHSETVTNGNHADGKDLGQMTSEKRLPHGWEARSQIQWAVLCYCWCKTRMNLDGFWWNRHLLQRMAVSTTTILSQAQGVDDGLQKWSTAAVSNFESCLVRNGWRMPCIFGLGQVC